MENRSREYQEVKQKYLRQCVIACIIYIILQTVLGFFYMNDFLAGILYLALLIYIIRQGILMRKRIVKLLMEDINLKAFGEYINSKMWLKLPWKNFVILLNKSYYYFLKGDFKESSRILNEFDEKKLTSLKPVNQILYYKQFLWIFIFTGNEEEYSSYLEKLRHLQFQKEKDLEKKENSLKELEALNGLMIKKQKTDFFDRQQASNRLVSLFYLYYKALNAQLSQDLEAAHAYFQELAQETDQLYIVRRAKEELSL